MNTTQQIQLSELLKVKISNPELLHEVVNSLTDREAEDLYWRLRLELVPKSKRWIVTIVVNSLYMFEKIDDAFKKLLGIELLPNGKEIHAANGSVAELMQDLPAQTQTDVLHMIYFTAWKCGKPTPGAKLFDLVRGARIYYGFRLYKKVTLLYTNFSQKVNKVYAFCLARFVNNKKDGLS